MRRFAAAHIWKIDAALFAILLALVSRGAGLLGNSQLALAIAAAIAAAGFVIIPAELERHRTADLRSHAVESANRAADRVLTTRIVRELLGPGSLVRIADLVVRAEKAEGLPCAEWTCDQCFQLGAALRGQREQFNSATGPLMADLPADGRRIVAQFARALERADGTAHVMGKSTELLARSTHPHFAEWRVRQARDIDALCGELTREFQDIWAAAMAMGDLVPRESDPSA